jgi:Putative peptidoglycan binding domain
MVPPERLFMRLIKGSLAGLVLTGILAIVPAAAFAHGGGGSGGGSQGGGGGNGGGGGGHGMGGGGHGMGGGRAQASIAGGHAFSGFTGREFSPGFSGMRVFHSGRFSRGGDDGRFRDRDFRHHGNFQDKDERHHRDFFNDFDFVAFGFPDWWYPDYGYVDYGYSDADAYDESGPTYGDQYWQDLAMKVQWALSQRGYYHGPIDGVIGPDGIRAIQAFQEAQGWPATRRIDPNVLRALKLPIPQIALRSK